MKKLFVIIALLFSLWVISYTITLLMAPRDYKQDSRHFFCLKNGKCVTMWRTRNGVCYIIPGKYTGNSIPPSQGYVSSPFNNKLDIIWQKNTESVIVNLENKDEQVIHHSDKGIKIIDYNSNKNYNDKFFLYSDGEYNRYKKNVMFITLDIKEECAYGTDGKRMN